MLKLVYNPLLPNNSLKERLALPPNALPPAVSHTEAANIKLVQGAMLAILETGPLYVCIIVVAEEEGKVLCLWDH